MVEHYFGLIEALFVFGLAIAFYVWQMRDLKKENAKARAACTDAASADTVSDRSRSDEQRK